MSSKLTNAEIAKQFQLPERKSKLKSLFKQEREEYCLCRSSDTTRFMIACDACEDWFHGDCIGISEKESKIIKLYYCEACRSEDPTLRILYKPGRRSLESGFQEDRHFKRKYEDDDFFPPEPVYSHFDESPSKRGRPSKNGKPSFDSSKKNWKKLKQIPPKQSKIQNRGRKKADSDYESEGYSENVEESHEHVHISNVGSAYKDNMQCYGPVCVNMARKDSKYCSDDCGKKLATARLLHILPHRVNDWIQTDSVAETYTLKLYQEYRETEVQAKRCLVDLDKKNKELDEAIERAKQVEVDPENCKSNTEEADITLYCVTCGHEIHVRTALKHMEKCFNKYEGQSTFGSLYKTKIEGQNMFCDFYNPANRTYCKRLRVLCPEHFKDPKVGKNEICGCPLITEVFKETGEMCLMPKKDCTRHFGWEKLRQAEIDMERVRQWLKIDDVAEKQRQITSRVSGRVGALPLLLHSTYDHELKEKITPEEDKELFKILEHSLKNRYAKDRFENLKKPKSSKDSFHRRFNV